MASAYARGFGLRDDSNMRVPYDTGRFADVDGISNVTTITDVADVVQRMLSDLLAHPDEWENPTLESFLEALAASLRGIPHGYANRGEQFPKEPNWRIVAEVLVMASGYE
jgi:hypothetical protein